MSAPLADGGSAFPHPVEFDPNGQVISHGSFGMSLRDYACIQLRVPHTGKPWLDELIAESQRDALAALAMPSFGDLKAWSVEGAAAHCYKLADAMIAARKENP